MLSKKTVDIIKAMCFFYEADKMFHIFMISDLRHSTQMCFSLENPHFGHDTITDSFESEQNPSSTRIVQDNEDIFYPDSRDGNIEKEFFSLFLWCRSKFTKRKENEIENIYKEGRRIVHYQWFKTFKLYKGLDVSVVFQDLWKALKNSSAIQKYANAIVPVFRSYVSYLNSQIPTDKKEYFAYLQKRINLTKENCWHILWQNEETETELNPFIKFKFMEQIELEKAKLKKDKFDYNYRIKKLGCPLKFFSITLLEAKKLTKDGLFPVLDNSPIHREFLDNLFAPWNADLEDDTDRIKDRTIKDNIFL